MSSWLDFDLDRTIHDFDYTRRAAVGINKVIDSADFAEMDADRIFEYLSGEMEIVLFPDYLKRFIYEKIKPDMEFRDVQDDFYQDVLRSSIDDNHAPYSLSPTTTKKGAMIRLWLSQPGTKRSTIFALGYILRMTTDEVSEFLTKVLKEEDFNFMDPDEVLHWYCFANDYPYSTYLKMSKQYQSMSPGNDSAKRWKAMYESPTVYLLSEENLLFYLAVLKTKNSEDNKKETAYQEYVRLYELCREIILKHYNDEESLVSGKKEWKLEQIRPADLEKILCSGIPLTGKNNLKAMADSRLGNIFKNKRMSRQRISSILNRKQPVDRFDLITLLFYIYAETVEPDWPVERYLQYIEAADEELRKCGMMGIYPVNPYEAFVLMCIVAEEPLDVYSQIWEMAYEGAEGM